MKHLNSVGECRIMQKVISVLLFSGFIKCSRLLLLQLLTTVRSLQVIAPLASSAVHSSHPAFPFLSLLHLSVVGVGVAWAVFNNALTG